MRGSVRLSTSSQQVWPYYLYSRGVWWGEAFHQQALQYLVPIFMIMDHKISTHFISSEGAASEIISFHWDLETAGQTREGPFVDWSRLHTQLHPTNKWYIINSLYLHLYLHSASSGGDFEIPGPRWRQVTAYLPVAASQCHLPFCS